MVLNNKYLLWTICRILFYTNAELLVKNKERSIITTTSFKDIEKITLEANEFLQGIFIITYEIVNSDGIYNRYARIFIKVGENVTIEDIEKLKMLYKMNGM